MTQYSGVLKLQSASVSLPDRQVLRDIHMTMGEGEFCFLKGRSGSGKTSLIQALYGIGILEGNIIKVVGEDLPKTDRNELALYRRKVGWISDNYNLLPGLSVFDNMDQILIGIDWPAASDREKRISEVLDISGLANLRSESVNHLSTGQKQKLKVCRAVMNRPKLILADAPTAGLDAQSTEEVIDLLIHVATENQSSVLWATASDRIPERYPARSYLCADGTVTEMN